MGEAGAAFFDASELLYDMTGGELDIFQQPLVRAMGEYIMKMYIHGNYFINFADCHGQIRVNAFMIARFGRRVRARVWRISPYPKSVQRKDQLLTTATICTGV
ncbi:MAG: hypothetical protein ACLR23_02380 [Clostridia bacterium]